MASPALCQLREIENRTIQAVPAMPPVTRPSLRLHQPPDGKDHLGRIVAYADKWRYRAVDGHEAIGIRERTSETFHLVKNLAIRQRRAEPQDALLGQAAIFHVQYPKLLEARQNRGGIVAQAAASLQAEALQLDQRLESFQITRRYSRAGEPQLAQFRHRRDGLHAGIRQRKGPQA